MPTPDELKQLGMLLRHAREGAGLRKSEVARRAGVSPAYVAFIEDARPSTQGKGNPSRPSQEVLQIWMRVVGMDEERTQTVLSLAGYPVRLRSAIESGEVLSRYDTQPWPVTRDALLQQMREVLRLTEHSPARDEVTTLLHQLLELVKLRIAQEESE